MISNLNNGLQSQLEVSAARNNPQGTGAVLSSPSTEQKTSPPEMEAESKEEGMNMTSEVMERVFDISEVGTILVQTGSDVITESGIKGGLNTAAHVGSAAAGLFFAVKGSRDLKKGIDKKDNLQAINGMGELALAGEAGISSLQYVSQFPSVGNAIGKTATSFICSPLMKSLGSTLGFVYAASELVEGIHLVNAGLVQKNTKKVLQGALNIGLSIAAGALFTTGGAPAAIILGGLSLLELGAFGEQKVEEAVKNWQRTHPHTEPQKENKLKTLKPLAQADLSQVVVAQPYKAGEKSAPLQSTIVQAGAPLRMEPLMMTDLSSFNFTLP
jgi:hypothetical protein